MDDAMDAMLLVDKQSLAHYGWNRNSNKQLIFQMI